MGASVADRVWSPVVFDRGSDLVHIGVIDAEGHVCAVRSSVRGAEVMLEVDGSLGWRTRLMTGEACAHVKHCMNAGESRVDVVGEFGDLYEICGGEEVWSPPCERGVLGIGARKRLGADGSEEWCVQCVMPANFRFVGSDVELRVREVARCVWGEVLGLSLESVSVIPGCVEVWSRDEAGVLAEWLEDSVKVQTLAELWLRRMDEAFAPDEQGMVVDQVEARRQLLEMGLDYCEAETWVREAAVRGGQVEEAALIDVAREEMVKNFVTMVDLPGGQGVAVLGTGRTFSAARAEVVRRHCLPGRWPLHVRPPLRELMRSEGETSVVLHDQGVVLGTLECTDLFAQAVRSRDMPVVVGRGFDVSLARLSGVAFGSDEWDFEVLAEGRSRGGVGRGD